MAQSKWEISVISCESMSFFVHPGFHAMAGIRFNLLNLLTSSGAEWEGSTDLANLLPTLLQVFRFMQIV